MNEFNKQLASIEKSHLRGVSSITTAKKIAEMYNELVRKQFLTQRWEPRISLLATGGFGRKQMAPFSDVDLLMLSDIDPKKNKTLENSLVDFLHFLWNRNIDVSYAVRSEQQCLDLATKDFRVFAGLLDMRFIAGDEERATLFARQFKKHCIEQNKTSFINSLIAAFRNRHLRYGDSVYLLEPHIKSGRGGLRDVQTMLWILSVTLSKKYSVVSDLRRLPLIGQTELKEILEQAFQFIWQVRHTMHFVRRRNVDLLDFALQEDVAEKLGYGRARGDVATFMSDYYRSAKSIETVVGSALAESNTLLSEKRIKELPKLNREQVFEKIQSFVCSEVPMDSQTARAIRSAVLELPQTVHSSKRVKELLRNIFISDNVFRNLDKLHELGMLERLIPEFASISHLFQRDLYHVYTVDIHSLMAVKHLESFIKGQQIGAYPFLSDLVRSLPSFKELFLATLLHDCGKGSGKPHERESQKKAERVCKRLDWSKESTDTVSFLVANHLLLPMVASKRDIHDPEEITKLAKQVGTIERLRQLIILTIVDQMSVGPKMLSQWKLSLLLQLYQNTERHFIAKHRDETLDLGLVNKRRLQAKYQHQREILEFIARLPDEFFREQSGIELNETFALYTQSRQGEMAVAVHQRQHGETTALQICALDRPGLFAVLCGALAATNLNILNVQLFTTDDGIAVDSFEVEGKISSAKRFTAKLEKITRNCFQGREIDFAPITRSLKTSSLSRRRVPTIEPNVAISNRKHPKLSILELTTRDRKGLLFEVARSLFEHEVNIHFARIHTEGQRVIDTFFISELNGSTAQKILNRSKLTKLRQALNTIVSKID